MPIFLIHRVLSLSLSEQRLQFAFQSSKGYFFKILETKHNNIWRLWVWNPDFINHWHIEALRLFVFDKLSFLKPISSFTHILTQVTSWVRRPSRHTCNMHHFPATQFLLVCIIIWLRNREVFFLKMSRSPTVRHDISLRNPGGGYPWCHGDHHPDCGFPRRLMTIYKLICALYQKLEIRYEFKMRNFFELKNLCLWSGKG